MNRLQFAFCLVLVFSCFVSLRSQQPPSETVYQLVPGITAPKVIKSQHSKYSREAQLARLEGNVVLSVVVDTKGRPANISVEKPLGLGLDEQAIKAVRKWRFTPGTKDGIPVNVQIHVDVAFRLEEPQPSDVYNVGGGVSAPKVIYSPDPEYSKEAKQARWDGTVVLQAIVDTDGKPKYLKVVKSLGHGLDEKAVEAVQGWQFSPAMKDGKPVKVRLLIEVTYHLY